MGTSERLNAVRGLLPGLISLAESPFELDAYKSICRSLGWSMDLDCDSFFTAWSPAPHFQFKMAIDHEESSAGLAICAVGDFEAQPDFYLETKEELDSAYFNTLQIVGDVLGQPERSGKYERTPLSTPCDFAYWSYSHAFIILIEHDETEFSNNPSLDLRLLPRHDEQTLEFPLNTNLLLC